MTPLIRGKRVVLREKRLQDAHDDYAWRCDEELARLDAALPLRLPFSEYLRLFTEELEAPLPWSRRLAIDTLDAKHMGNCMYYDIDTVRQEAEVGIMIGDRGYWDRGYGTDVVSTLVEHIFTTTSLKRLYLHTLEWNTRAQRCFQKCGFQPVRTVRRNGRSFILMELYRSQWEQLRHDQARPEGEVASPEGAPR